MKKFVLLITLALASSGAFADMSSAPQVQSMLCSSFSVIENSQQLDYNRQTSPSTIELRHMWINDVQSTSDYSIESLHFDGQFINLQAQLITTTEASIALTVVIDTETGLTTQASWHNTWLGTPNGPVQNLPTFSCVVEF